MAADLFPFVSTASIGTISMPIQTQSKH